MGDEPVSKSGRKGGEDGGKEEDEEAGRGAKDVKDAEVGTGRLEEEVYVLAQRGGVLLL